MKKRNFWLALASVATFSLGACNNDDTQVNDDPVAQQTRITLSAYLNSSTRATQNLQSTQITQDAQAGVFASDGAAEADLEYAAQYVNRNFRVDASANLIQNDEGVELAFPQVETPSANIFAYVPYNAAWTDLAAEQTFEVKADQSADANYLASDLLYGVPTTNPVSAATSATQQDVKLNFTHKLSKVNLSFTVVATDKELSLAGATAKLQNVATSIQINLSTGVLTPMEGAAVGEVIMASVPTATDRTTTYSCSGIIVPQTVKAGTTLVVLTTANKQKYELVLSNDIEFKENGTTNLQLEVGNTELPVIKMAGNSSLAGWAEPVIIEGTMDKVITYNIGDFVRKDGTIVPADANLAENYTNANPIVGIIFSNEVSATDAESGYKCYVMALRESGSYRFLFTDKKDADGNPLYDPATFPIIESLPGCDKAAALKDLDGRTNTEAILKYAADHNISFYGLTDMTKNNLWCPTLGEFNRSDWFIPSFGQLWQMLTNIGGLTDEDFASSDKILSETVYTNLNKAIADKFIAANIEGLNGGIFNAKNEGVTSYQYVDFSINLTNSEANVRTSTVYTDQIKFYNFKLSPKSNSLWIDRSDGKSGNARLWYVFAM